MSYLILLLTKKRHNANSKYFPYHVILKDNYHGFNTIIQEKFRKNIQSVLQH